jgi:protein TonB
MTKVLARSVFAIMFALLLNGGLFWTLESLTNVSFDIEAVEATRIDFTRMRQDTETASRREEKIERELPPVTPEIPSIALNSGDVGGNVVSLAPTIDTGGAMTGLQLGAGSDRDVMPLVRINPDYPPRALNRGIEGWVQVQFTITEQGTVTDAIVVDSSPKNIFDEAALKAISRWRYNPKVEGGVSQARIGMQTILRFTLED